MSGFLEKTHDEASVAPHSVVLVDKAPLGTDQWKRVGEMVTCNAIKVGELLHVRKNSIAEEEFLPEEKVMSIQDNSNGVLVETRSSLYRLRHKMLASNLPEWAYGPANFISSNSLRIADFATDYVLDPIMKTIDPIERFLRLR